MSEDSDLAELFRNADPAAGGGADPTGYSADQTLEAILGSPRHMGTAKLRRATSRPKRVLILLASPGLLAGLLIGLVTTDIVGLAGWRGSAQPAAAVSLIDAAESIEGTAPYDGAGNYLLTSKTGFVTGISNSCDSCTGNPELAKEPVDEELYVPRDSAVAWVWVRTRPSGEIETVRAIGGRFYAGASSADRFPVGSQDPYRFLNSIYRSAPIGTADVDQFAFAQIRDALRAAGSTAADRATLLRAAAMIPGVELLSDAGSDSFVISRTGSGIRVDVGIDHASGRLVSEREVQLDAQPGVPPGTVLIDVTLHTEAVDAAPAGGDFDGHIEKPAG